MRTITNDEILEILMNLYGVCRDLTKIQEGRLVPRSQGASPRQMVERVGDLLEPYVDGHILR